MYTYKVQNEMTYLHRLLGYLVTKVEKLTRIFHEEGLIYVSHILFNVSLDLIDFSIRHIYYKCKYKSGYANPYKLLWVDPSKIELVTRPQFSHDYSTYGTHVLGGDWDLRLEVKNYNMKRGTIDFDRYEFYGSMHEHFCQGISWEDTSFFDRKLKNPNKTGRHGSKSKIRSRFREIENLYESIDENGYKKQSQLQKNNFGLPFMSLFKSHDEIKVNIGRDGRLIFEDGRHRMSIAKILDVNRIPIRILVRHKEWQKKRNSIANLGNLNQKTKKNIDHPDLQDVLA